MTDCSGGSVQRFIRIAQQTDFATESSTFKYQGVAQNADDAIQQESFESRGLEMANALQNTAGVRTSTTSVDFDYQIGRVFNLQFSGVTHALTTGDTVHTFNVNSLPPYLTVVVGSDAQSARGAKHTGHIVDSMTIQYELNGNVQVAISTLGTYREPVTAKPSHSALTSQVLTYRNATLTLNSTDIKRVQSASISIASNLEAVSGSEDQDPSCHIFLGRTVEWTANAAMNTNEFRTHITANTLATVTLDVNNGVTLGSGRVGFEIELNKLVITNLEETGAVGGITTFTISGTGVISSLAATDQVAEADF
jgi:hypothetical protein